MKSIKKSVLYIIFLSSTLKCFSFTFENLLKMVVESNPEINSALITYKTNVLSSKNLDGAYVPNVSVSASTKLAKEYNWNALPNYFSSNITFFQPLPGGATISLETSYTFNTSDSEKVKFISQNPQISFNLSQSLLPFWIQGKIQDPLRLSLKQQEKYFYYQYLFTKKKVLQNFLQNYIYMLISKNEILMYKNSIELYEEQIKSLTELKLLGNTTLDKIIEIENSKWNVQQSLMTSQTNYEGYIQNLKILCGQNFENSFIDSCNTENLKDTVLEFCDIEDDPLEETYKIKLEILQAERILERQNSAPTINFSIQPNWTLETTKQDEWKKAWENMGSPSSWNVSIGINLSPLFLGLAKENKKKYELNYEDTKNSYNSYMLQKKSLKQQYTTLLNYYLLQKNTISSLYEAGLRELDDYKYQYAVNTISKLDLYSVNTRIENCRLTKENIELFVLLYEILLIIN